MLRTLVSLQVLALHTEARLRQRLTDERGQSTAEYALVLLGAATVALLFVAWAAKSGKIGELLDAVVDKVIGQV